MFLTKFSTDLKNRMMKKRVFLALKTNSGLIFVDFLFGNHNRNIPFTTIPFCYFRFHLLIFNFFLKDMPWM